MHESKEQGQTGEQSQGSFGGVCGSVEVRLGSCCCAGRRQHSGCEEFGTRCSHLNK